jgi:hypothetical protein
MSSAAMSLSEITDVMRELRQGLLGSLTQTVVEHTHESGVMQHRSPCPTCERSLTSRRQDVRRVETLSRVGWEVARPSPSPEPDKEMSTIRLFHRCALWRRLVPRPPGVLVTWIATSTRWAWVPPAAHIDTGRLYSAGSRSGPGPRCPCSSAALRLPAPLGHGSGSPCRWPPSMPALVLCLVRPTTRAPAHVSCVGDGSPARRKAGVCRGEARVSQVTGPSSSCVPWSNTPPATAPSSPTRNQQGVVVAFESSRPLGIREAEVSGPHSHGPHARRPTPRRGHF